MAVEIIEIIKNGVEVIEVIERGPQGPQGQAGGSGEGIYLPLAGGAMNVGAIVTLFTNDLGGGITNDSELGGWGFGVEEKLDGSNTGKQSYMDPDGLHTQNSGGETTNLSATSLLFNNGSKLQKGTTDAGLGGNGGIAQRCSIDYELKWEAGRLFTMQQDGFTIRSVEYCFTTTPTVNDDETKGFTIDSRWVLDDGTTYVCSDASSNAAVWNIQGVATHAATHADGGTDSIQPFAGVRFDTVTPDATPSTAQMVWNDTDGTVDMLLKGGNVNMQIGQSSIHRVYNDSGSPIAKGKVVYLYGSQGQRTTIRLADNASDTTSARTFGITAEAISNGAEGFVISEGVIKNVNTNGLADGTILWLGASGGYVGTRPTQPAHGVFLGIVVKGNSTGGGSIFVKIANGQELDELHDVLISSPSAGQVLARNTGNTLWVNKTLAPSDIGAAASSGSSDIEITDATKGIILKSPNNTRWRITVDNNGVLTTTAL